MVHGDEKFISFDATFPLAKEIKDMIYYTGYVVEPLGATDLVGRQGRGEVIVSSGSGAVGELILRTAIRIRRHTYLSKAKWRLLAGHFMDDNVFNDIVSYASDGIVVERARPDFLTLLKNSRLSISQGGYNTIMEALLSGTKCIAIPYAGGKETEQTLRAKALEQLGLIKQIPEGILTDEVLIRLVNETKNAARSKSSAIDLGGAPRSAEIMAQLIRATNSRY